LKARHPNRSRRPLKTRPNRSPAGERAGLHWTPGPVGCQGVDRPTDPSISVLPVSPCDASVSAVSRRRR
jgi:hypothetical protein